MRSLTLRSLFLLQVVARELRSIPPSQDDTTEQLNNNRKPQLYVDLLSYLNKPMTDEIVRVSNAVGSMVSFQGLFTVMFLCLLGSRDCLPLSFLRFVCQCFTLKLCLPAAFGTTWWWLEYQGTEKAQRGRWKLETTTKPLLIWPQQQVLPMGGTGSEVEKDDRVIQPDTTSISPSSSSS